MDEKLKIVTQPKGTVLFREGEPNNGKMYVVSEGIISAYRTLGGREQVVYQCAQGDIVGEISFLTGEPRTATCVVTTNEAKMYELDNETFDEMVHSNPNAALKVIRSLADKLRASERRAEHA